MNTTNKKIPILFFLHFLKGFGGTERHIFEVTKRLDRDKYIPFVCCLKLKKRMKEVFKENDVQVMELPLQKIYGFQAIKYGMKLIEFIKKEKIKIIQTFHILPDLYVPIVAKIAGTPVIISSRRDLGFDRKKGHLFVQKGINVLVDKIIVNSNAVKKTLIRNEQVSSLKITKIYNGVEMKNNKSIVDGQALRKKMGIEPSCFVVGLLSNMNPIKGCKYFVDACPIIMKQVPNTKFLIVGGGPLMEELKKRIRDLGVLKHTIFTGHLLNGTDYLSMMDVSVNSSLSEGFSNTILESMASGVPMVATQVGGNPEALVDGKTGLLVPPGDSSAIANAVIRILRDRTQPESMGKCAKKHAEEVFSMEKMMSEIENLYESLTNGKS